MRYALLVLAVAACAPVRIPPRRAEAERLQSLGDYCRASEEAKAWADEEPRSPSAWVLYADGAAYCGRRDEALAALARMDALRPGDADDVAAYLYMHLGEPRLSLRASDRYLRRRRGDVWHWLRRAQAAAAAGAEAPLREARERALEEAGRPGCEGVRDALRWNRAGYIAARLEESLRPPARLAARRVIDCAADEQGRREGEELLRLLDRGL